MTNLQAKINALPPGSKERGAGRIVEKGARIETPYEEQTGVVMINGKPQHFKVWNDPEHEGVQVYQEIDDPSSSPSPNATPTATATATAAPTAAATGNPTTVPLPGQTPGPGRTDDSDDDEDDYGYPETYVPDTNTGVVVAEGALLVAIVVCLFICAVPALA